MDLKNVGNKIKKQRIEKNMTQKNLADALNVSNQLISKWETGESVPSIEYMDKLCTVLDVSLNVLLGNNENGVKQKRKISKNTLKQIIISIIVFSAIMAVIGMTLIIYYVIVPATYKNEYVSEINQTIENFLVKNNYYNTKFYGTLDGNETSSIILQGYLDENQKIYSYNSLTETYIFGNVKVDNLRGYKSDYEETGSINTIQELFQQELITIGENNNLDFDTDEIKYIRKTLGGYYFECAENFFTENLTTNQKKNYELTQKIKGKIVVEDNCFVSMEIIIKFKDKPNNEDFTITSGVMFINEKPKIDASPLQNSIWNITSNDTSISNFLDTLTNNSSYINLDSLTSDILFNGSYFQTTSGQIYLIDNEKISQISTDSLSITNVEQFIKQGQEEVNNGRTYINDFSYVINGNYLEIKKESTGVEKEIYLKFSNPLKVYAYDNYVYIILFKYVPDPDSIYSPTWHVQVYDIETDKSIESSISCLPETATFNGRYAYWEWADGNWYVFDCSSGAIPSGISGSARHLVVYSIEYVDNAGNIYYKKKYNSPITIMDANDEVEELQGDYFLGATTDSIYLYELEYTTYGDISRVYKYQNSNIVEDYSPYEDNESTMRFIGNYHMTIADYKIYNSIDEEFKIEDIILNEQYYAGGSEYYDTHSFDILEVVGDKIIVSFWHKYLSSDHKEYQYLGIYELNDLARPKLLLCINDVKVKRLYDNLLISILTQEGGSYKTCYLSD